MTEQEICDLQRENNNSEMYLLLRGTFWRAYDGGAFALARVTGYQVRRLKNGRYVLGFPQNALERVLATMETNGIRMVKTDDEAMLRFSGGNPEPDDKLVDSPVAADAGISTKEINELIRLRQELMSFCLATATAQDAQRLVRDLQIRCLSQMNI